MDPLKLAVERIVKPIPANEHRKDTYRKELWAHLSDLYEEECLSGGDSDQCLERALIRLGEPAELRRQFLKSMPFHQRLFVPLTALMVPKENETGPRFLLRSARGSWPMFFALIMSFPLVTFVRHGAAAADFPTTPLFALNLIAMTCMFMLAENLMVYRSRRNAPDESNVWAWYRHYGALPFVSMIPVILVPTALYGIENLVFDLYGWYNVPLSIVTLAFFPRLGAFLLLFLALAPVLGMLEARTNRTIPDWPYTKV